MQRLSRLSILATIIVMALPNADAEPTTVMVHVLSRGTKFVGTGVGGAHVVLQDADTGEVLAQGLTQGGTGDTNRLMHEERRRGAPLATEGAAKFTAHIDLERPRKVRVTAHGLMAEPASANTVSATQWLMPGKSLTSGDAWLFELPGLIVRLHDTPTSVQLGGGLASGVQVAV